MSKSSTFLRIENELKVQESRCVNMLLGTLGGNLLANMFVVKRFFQDGEEAIISGQIF